MSTTHIDVLIIGAGLSGIDAACHLARECPEKDFLILEGRSEMGGTWDLFRYPGIRSDSDMSTFSYGFRPWTKSKMLAEGKEIKQYIEDTAAEYGVEEKVLYGHKALSADWCSKQGLWTIKAEGEGKAKTFTCKFLWSCTGYYNYHAGYTPEFEGRKAFKGTVVHPQHWPVDLDYTDKHVVVIGSGATAVTLIPSMAEQTAHITMLQRSPGYVVSIPRTDPVSKHLKDKLPDNWVFSLARKSNIAMQMLVYNLSRKKPDYVRKKLLTLVEQQVGKDVDMTHFTPSYQPWDQRLCAVPGGDLFKALRNGKASVVTDHIDRFVKDGILLKSGEHLKADIIVTATGLDLLMLGGMQLSVNGTPHQISDSVTYKGLMLSDVPNFAMTVGYTNASWTLKADLVSDYVCRLLKHMDKKDYRECVVRVPEKGLDVEPLMDMQSGYIQRAADRFPRQGLRTPWRLKQNYVLDTLMFKRSRIEDGIIQFDSSQGCETLATSTAS